VTDSTDAVVPAAVVEIVETGTRVRRAQSTNDLGQYVFPILAPGRYELTATKTGFHKAALTELTIEVAKSYVQNFRLEVGEVDQTVQVVAGAKVELQTVDATIGNVLSGQSLLLLPTFTRQANELLTLQPGVTPGKPNSPVNIGVTGALRDQTTVVLDGLDVTAIFGDSTGTFMYLGMEGVDEFRVGGQPECHIRAWRRWSNFDCGPPRLERSARGAVLLPAK